MRHRLPAGAAGIIVALVTATAAPAAPRPAGARQARQAGARVTGAPARNAPAPAVLTLGLGSHRYPVPPTDDLRAGRATAVPADTAARIPAHTLTLTATNLAGNPDTGDDVFLVNVDNTNLISPASMGQVFKDGKATYRVPAGHYFAFGSFGDAKSPNAPTRIVVLPQFTVSGNTTVSMHETAATSKITMTTPRPAAPVGTGFYLARTGTKGPLFYAEWTDAGFPVRVNPTHTRPTVGTLRTYANQALAAPSGSATRYSYELSYTDPPGTIPSQHYRVQPPALAAVTERYYQPVKSPGSWVMSGGFPTASQATAFLGYVEPYLVPLRLPGTQTVYVGGAGNASMIWGSSYYPATFFAPATEAGHQLSPGSHLTDDWNVYPLHPAPSVKLYRKNTALGGEPASATRDGNTLRLGVTPFSDNQFGHTGNGLRPGAGARLAGTYQIDQNGVKVASGNAVQAADGAPWVALTAHLRPKPGTIRFALTASRTGPDFPLSVRSHTVWTWYSAPVTAAKLPRGWLCGFNPPLSRDCAVQPMMTLLYHVAHLSLTESAPVGAQSVSLTVGQIQPGTSAKITGAKMSASFDGGQTWHTATVTRTGNARFRADFTAPAGAKVTLRTSATDAIGGSITETILNGYQISSQPEPHR